jgi:homopolymeric O-antigen transport system permease protein
MQDRSRQMLDVASTEEKAPTPVHGIEPVTRVEPPSLWRSLDLGEIWHHRELLYFLALRDVKVRYKQTAFGVGWALLQPVLMVLLFSLVFGRLVKIPSAGLPYPVFVFAALVPWTFFANAVTAGSNSVVATPNLVTKIYFPRVLMPTASVLSGLPDVAIASAVLLVTTLAYGIVPGPQALLLLPLLLLAMLTATGVALWLGALNVEYRDVRYTLPFLIQLWLFATPVVYPSSLAGEPWQTIMGINPMAGVVEGFRWALLDAQPAPGALLLASIGAAVAVFATGFVYFRRVEDRFADVI